jgi:uncharacterized protein
MTDETQDSGPVTVSVARLVKTGHEVDYENWLKNITSEALKFPGHMGVNVIRPTSKSGEYVTIFRFDSYEHLKAWEDSTIRNEYLIKLEGIVEGEAKVKKGTGLEFWFNLPELPVCRPSPHKMAFVLLVVVFTMVALLNYLLAPITHDWPMLARLFATISCQVILMTYLVMPRVTRLLKPWLYGNQK